MCEQYEKKNYGIIWGREHTLPKFTSREPRWVLDAVQVALWYKVLKFYELNFIDSLLT
jgi:hypothetical protein